MRHHITEDPKLPCYTHPALRHLSEALKVVNDVWNGLYAIKADYLPRSYSEPPVAYSDRLSRSVFNNKFRGQIESISGLLTAFEIDGLPASFDRAIADGLGIDGQGSDFKSLLRTADEMALRDGNCYILANNPQLSPDEAQGRTAADPATTPQYTLIDRRNVLNWRVEQRGGVPVLTQVTILFDREMPEGDYGYTVKPLYYTFRLVEGGVSLTVSEISDRGIALTLDQRNAPLERIPLHSYPDITEPFPCKDKPQLPYLLKSALLNVKLFQQDSSLDTIQYRVNAPTVYRISSLPFEERPPIIFGPNHVIELMRDTAVGTAGTDEVGIVEISGAGVEALRASIEQTKREIDEEGVGFMVGGAVQRSATEAYLSATRATATLKGWARAKTAAIAAIIQDWCLFTGEDTGAVEIASDEAILEQPLDAAELGQLLATWQAGGIDQETFLELLRMGRQLPPGAKIQEILDRVRAERDAAMPNPAAIANGILLGESSEPTNEQAQSELP
jgi:hypothetical protein